MINKKLGIKGHPTRGKEIIELLEMMGGKNSCDSTGDNLGLCYLIDDEFDICAHYFGYDDYEDGEINIFTLEEFLKKYPFKVGDRVLIPEYESEVRICEMRWNPLCEYMEYKVYRNEYVEWYTAEELLNYNEEFLRDKEKSEETQSKREYSEIRMPLDDDDKLATEATIMGKRILPPDGYLVGKITQTDNGMLVEYVEKKSKYPTTYGECCEVLSIPPYYNLRYHTYEHGYNELATSNELLAWQGKLNILGKLLICQKAYRKIAGEEMGLGKPWEPDWNDEDEYKYGLFRLRNIIYKDTAAINPTLLIFPTKEIRDAFYENFKDLIEQCKELL